MARDGAKHPSGRDGGTRRRGHDGTVGPTSPINELQTLPLRSGRSVQRDPNAPWL